MLMLSVLIKCVKFIVFALFLCYDRAMKRKILALLLTVFTVGGFVTMAAPAPAMALSAGKSCGAPAFFGFKAWYAGLCDSDTNGKVVQPQSEDDTVQFVWTIVLNILFDLFLAIGYLAVGFVIYGGFLYITAQGDPGRALKGQKTLTTAVIGTIIAMSATVIVNTAKLVLGIDGNGWNQSGLDTAQLKDVFNWVYAVAGLVAVVFLIKAGIEYTISHGDMGKTQKAMRSVIYSVVGLVIVLLAAVITNFVMNATSDSLNNADLGGLQDGGNSEIRQLSRGSGEEA